MAGVCLTPKTPFPIPLKKSATQANIYMLSTLIIYSFPFSQRTPQFK